MNGKVDPDFGIGDWCYLAGYDSEFGWTTCEAIEGLEAGFRV